MLYTTFLSHNYPTMLMWQFQQTLYLFIFLLIVGMDDMIIKIIQTKIKKLIFIVKLDKLYNILIGNIDKCQNIHILALNLHLLIS